MIVVSEDVDLTKFQAKVTGFATSAWGSGTVAQIHELKEDLSQDERLSRILTPLLLSEWPAMQDDQIYVCDVSIACVGTWEVPAKPGRDPRWKPQTWARRENE